MQKNVSTLHHTLLEKKKSNISYQKNFVCQVMQTQYFLTEYTILRSTESIVNAINVKTLIVKILQ